MAFVKFIKGTTLAFNRLAEKDPDTLYFVYNTTHSTSGKLYLGDKLIGGTGSGEIGLGDLGNIDVNPNDLTEGCLLAYDADTKNWVAANPRDLVYEGAGDGVSGVPGLVPPATSGEKDLYLRGDGTWDDPVARVVADAPETLNTFRAVADWIQSDETGTVALINRVTNIENKLTWGTI